ncbi:MAG: Uma2 family endonuclease [Tepidiformaceae bacterium]
MPVSEATYRLVATEDPDGQWERTSCGDLRRKPDMAMQHNDVARLLAMALQAQLPLDQYTVSVNSARARLPNGASYIPDVMVVPTPAVLALRGTTDVEAYDDPLPLVVEVWSPSTGGYDIEEKVRDYRERGDREIWRIHPYERTLTAWRRQPDGSYGETHFTSGEVSPASLPGVVIRLESLFR